MHAREPRKHCVAIVGMEDTSEEVRIRDPFVARVPDELRNLRADVHRALLVETLDIADERELFDERPVPPLGLTQSLTCLPLVRDVPPDAHHPAGTSIRITNDLARDRAQPGAAVGEHDTELELESITRLGSRVQGTADAVPVVGV